MANWKKQSRIEEGSAVVVADVEQSPVFIADRHFTLTHVPRPRTLSYRGFCFRPFTQHRVESWSSLAVSLVSESR
jgi:hypothetical protein